MSRPRSNTMHGGADGGLGGGGGGGAGLLASALAKKVSAHHFQQQRRQQQEANLLKELASLVREMDRTFLGWFRTPVDFWGRVANWHFEFSQKWHHPSFNESGVWSETEQPGLVSRPVGHT